ncbi:MAG: T9SS type A sorting domain-containing protein [Bacteroidales bacterium]|nr:T9SS type A sorting domain-containing protein [Bacteroidales bacterium]
MKFCEWTPMLTFTTDTVPTGGGSGDGIEDFSKVLFEIFPNPASDNITVSTEEEATMTIFDQTGRTFAQQHLVMGNNVIDVSSYAAGIYYVRITTEKGSAVRKLIVR